MKKTIISFCIIAFTAATTFTSCQKETAQPSGRVNAGTTANISKSKNPTGYTGTTGTSDTTQTKTNP